MASVTRKNEYEHFDKLLRRFKKAVESDDVIRRFCDKTYYEKPTTKRKKAKDLAIKRGHRKLRDYDNNLIEMRLQSRK